MDGSTIPRRSLLKTAAATAGFAVLGGGPILGSMRLALAQTGLSGESLHTIGLPVTVQHPILLAFEKASGVRSVTGTVASYPDALTEITSGGYFDCWEIAGERLPGLIGAKKADPISPSALKNWPNIRPIFTTLSPQWPAKAQIAGQIWVDETHTQLYMVPAIFNFDSIGYNPDRVTAEEANSWTCLFDDKFKGRSALNADPLVAMGEAILAMNTLGLLEVKNPGNPPKEAIAEATKFLIAKKKSGQFRVLWSDLGQMMDLLAASEVVVSDAWQPTVMAVKALGKPCKYAVPKEGYRAWAIGPAMLAGTRNREAVLAYADYWLSGPPGIAISEQCYYSSATTIEKEMAPDRYAFWYLGAPWKGAPWRGINPGDVRDGGSLAERSAHIAYWHQWADEHDYLLQQWDEFVRA